MGCGGTVLGYGFEDAFGVGSLAPNFFTIGSNSYTIEGAFVGNAVFDLLRTSDSLNLALASDLTSAERAALEVHVCDSDGFGFSNTDEHDLALHRSTWRWDGSDWSPPVMTRTLYLSLSANRDATGEPAISGTATAGQVLTATTGTIADADGLPSSFTYQWLRVDGDGTSNEEDISGEIAATYTLTDDDVRKTIKVKVSFTDNLSGEDCRAHQRGVSLDRHGHRRRRHQHPPDLGGRTSGSGRGHGLHLRQRRLRLHGHGYGRQSRERQDRDAAGIGHGHAHALGYDDRVGGPAEDGTRGRNRRPEILPTGEPVRDQRCEFHLQGERWHGRQRQRLHDYHRRERGGRLGDGQARDHGHGAGGPDADRDGGYHRGCGRVAGPLHHFGRAIRRTIQWIQVDGVNETDISGATIAKPTRWPPPTRARRSR